MLMKKKRAVYVLISAVFTMVGTVYYSRHAIPHHPIEDQTTLAQTPTVHPKKDPGNPRQDLRAAIPASPKPAAEQPGSQTPLNRAEPSQELTPHQRRLRAYWMQRAQRFNRYDKMLDQEENSARRMRLIRTMSRYVRIDTLNTLDWAMSLEDPAEQRYAMEAINKNALVGIGAHIKMDETGLPRILNTTVLSAVASTGMVEPGDYISAMVRADGSLIDFKNRSLRQIVSLLHGQPGTAVRLIMERPATEDQIEPTLFEVPVERSMIIMDPTFQ